MKTASFARNWLAVFSLLLIGAGAGCRTAIELSPMKVATDCAVTRDTALGYTSVQSPQVTMRRSGEQAAYQLGAKQFDSSQDVLYLFRFISRREGVPARWKDIFIDGRRHAPGEAMLSTNSLPQTFESVVVVVSRAALENMRDRSIRVSMVGENSTWDFNVAPPVPAGFLMRCDEVLRRSTASDVRFLPIR